MSPDFLDSTVWWMRFVAPLLTSRWFPRWPALDDDPAFAAFARARLADALDRFFGGTPRDVVWGWKFPETLFVMPIVARLLPGARFIHVIRDGRDVCLSNRGFFQLTGVHDDPPGWDVPPLGDGAPPGVDPAARPRFVDFCRALTFGDAMLHWWRGLDLDDRLALVEHRYLIQMQSWCYCVETARAHGRALGDAYLEIRYEALCRQPVETIAASFDRLGLALPATVADELRRTVHPAHIAKWQRERLSPREARDLADAIVWGAPLLAELGYR